MAPRYGRGKLPYDGLGRRLWSRCGEIRREFYWDGDRLAAEILPGGRVRIYVYADLDALVPLGFTDYESLGIDPDRGRDYYVFSDPVGMPLRLEDRGGHVAWLADYIDPYGQIAIRQNGSLGYNLRWPGHYFDPETGLHYNRYRYDDPLLGRYLQSDPIGYAGSESNLYAYCPNPLMNVDILGLAHKSRKGGKNAANEKDGKEGTDSSAEGSGKSKKQGDHVFAKGMQKVGDEMNAAAQASDMSDSAKARVASAATEIDAAVSDPVFSRTVDKGPTPAGGDDQSKTFGNALNEFRTDQENFNSSVADAESAPPSQRDDANANMQQKADKLNDSFGKVTGSAEDTDASKQMNDPKATQAGRDGLGKANDSMKSMTDDIVKSTTEGNAPPSGDPPPGGDNSPSSGAPPDSPSSSES